MPRVCESWSALYAIADAASAGGACGINSHPADLSCAVVAKELPRHDIWRGLYSTHLQVGVPQRFARRHPSLPAQSVAVRFCLRGTLRNVDVATIGCSAHRLLEAPARCLLHSGHAACRLSTCQNMDGHCTQQLCKVGRSERDRFTESIWVGRVCSRDIRCSRDFDACQTANMGRDSYGPQSHCADPVMPSSAPADE